MKTHTRKGALKMALTDPIGRLPSEDSVSVVLSSEQASELTAELRNLGEKIDLLNQHMEILINHL